MAGALGRPTSAAAAYDAQFSAAGRGIVGWGSIYWVINRIVTARQRLLDIVEGAREDGSKGCDLLLDPVLVPVRGVFMKPFQGWRYLGAEDAPADDGDGSAGAALPEEVRRDLVRLGLL